VQVDDVVIRGSLTKLDMQRGRQSRDEADFVCDSGVALSDAALLSQSLVSDSSHVVGLLPSLQAFTDDGKALARGDAVTTSVSSHRSQLQLLQLLNADDDGDTYVSVVAVITASTRICAASADLAFFGKHNTNGDGRCRKRYSPLFSDHRNFSKFR